MKDKLRPSVCGIGFIGVGKYTSKVAGVPTKEYTTWHSMLVRCYDANYHSKQPTYTQCEVTSDWHNFQVFAEWYNEQPNAHLKGYVLDKDSILNGNKIYCPEYCCIITHSENSQHRNGTLGIEYTLIHNELGKCTFRNTADFCRKYSLDHSSVRKVLLGTRLTTKGWRLEGTVIESKLYHVKSPIGIVYEFSNITKFSKEHALTRSGLSELVNGNRKIHKGWVLE